MRFLKFKVSNYKSFLDSPELSFRPGLNVIVGQNNSAKTALLEAMTLAYGDNHHRSLETMPRTTTSPNPQSTYEFVFEIDTVEARTLMLDQFPTAYVAIPEEQPLGIEADKVASIINSTFAVRATYSASPGVSEAFLEAFPTSLSSPHVVKCVAQIGGISVDRNTVFGARPQDRLPFHLVNVFRPRIYAFRAERQNVGECAIADSPVLEPNASNLASVLLLLQSNNSRFRRYESFVKNIFPQIKQITVRPVSGRARILVWTVQPESERIDLAFALAECGTGIGQVLSILYVVLTAEQPRALLIDEPQSFLHPGAIRKLLEIFAAHPQHQYIITTHSPTALASFPPSTLTLLTMDDPKSIARQVNPTEATELRAVLAEVGARLSDVFGADNILWVELREASVRRWPGADPYLCQDRPHVPIRSCRCSPSTTPWWCRTCPPDGQFRLAVHTARYVCRTSSSARKLAIGAWYRAIPFSRM
jgi:predicted ATPase